MLDLVKYFGPENVYISIYESGSWDDSKGALRLLDNDLQELGVRRTITLDDTTHANEIQKPSAAGWIDTSRGKKELRRIPYLSILRNLSLKPLAGLAQENIKFDKVLFLNDVVFTVCVNFNHSELGKTLTRSLDRRCRQAHRDSRWRIRRSM